MSLSWTTRHCWTLETGEWRCRSQDRGYHPEKEERVVSSGYIWFHCACPQALHPLALSPAIILQDRHHRRFMNDSLAPPSPNLPSHCLSFQGLGLGFQPGSGTPHPNPLALSTVPYCIPEEHYCLLHAITEMSIKWDTECGWCASRCTPIGFAEPTGREVWPISRQPRPNLTQLPPQPFRREIRECFCL